MANGVDSRRSICRQQDKKYLSIFDVSFGFFESCRLIPPHSSSSSFPEPNHPTASAIIGVETLNGSSREGFISEITALSTWSCNTCKVEFESLPDQRFHFKSDIHRFNIKLSMSGKNILTEDAFDELNSESLLKDYDVSSISGSDDEVDKTSCINFHRELVQCVRQKLFILLHTGETISIWKCLLMDVYEEILYNHYKPVDEYQQLQFVTESKVIDNLKYLAHEPRDNTKLRVVLLASGGHFAGCIFDGNLVVAHKTFHRYVVRARAGKKQSSKDGTGKSAMSAGASLRRYNENALKKEIQETLAAWKPYFDASSCVFIYAPSSNRQLLFNGEKPYFSSSRAAIRSVPFSVRRPTLKEARRVYTQLLQVTYEEDDKEFQPSIKEDSLLEPDSVNSKDAKAPSTYDQSNEPSILSNGPEILTMCVWTPLHEASKSCNSEKVLECLENGSDPCAKDERGRTPYMLATEKEVRNTFRRFMAANSDKWDWVAAKVPSALTQEMEESQAAKQEAKDAKRKAKSKELKKLRKAREKKAQAEAALKMSTSRNVEDRNVSGEAAGVPKEEKLKKAQAEEREMRAAAAERRLAAQSAAPSRSTDCRRGIMELYCSYCKSSLGGNIPFHRYDFKYCTTTCMDLHREIL